VPGYLKCSRAANARSRAGDDVSLAVWVIVAECLRRHFRVLGLELARRQTGFLFRSKPGHAPMLPDRNAFAAPPSHPPPCPPPRETTSIDINASGMGEPGSSLVNLPVTEVEFPSVLISRNLMLNAPLPFTMGTGCGVASNAPAEPASKDTDTDPGWKKDPELQVHKRVLW
jgi:hypothetical protein